MGSDLLEQIENFNSLELAVFAKRKHKDVEKSSGIVIGDDINNLIKCSDVIIDFTIPSHHQFIRGNARFKNKNN